VLLDLTANHTCIEPVAHIIKEKGLLRVIINHLNNASLNKRANTYSDEE
jgi:hypothetical protein